MVDKERAVQTRGLLASGAVLVILIGAGTVATAEFAPDNLLAAIGIAIGTLIGFGAGVYRAFA